MQPVVSRSVARLAGVGILVIACGLSGAQVDAPKVPQNTRLDPIIIREFGGNKSATKPSRDAVMGFSLATQVREVSVHGGQEVTKGTLLIKGDDAEDLSVLKLQKAKADSNWPVQRAQAQMDLAKLEYERLKEIRGKEGSSVQEVERARLTYETATDDFESAKVQQTQELIQVERLQARVDKFHLLAPFDGQVDNVMVDSGHAVTENEKVLRIVNVDPLWMDVPAPTDDPVTLGLKQGDKAWVLLDIATGPRISEGKVIEVGPTTDLASRSRRIRVELPNPKGAQRVLAGEPAWVRFSTPPAAVMTKVTAAAAQFAPSTQAVAK